MKTRCWFLWAVIQFALASAKGNPLLLRREQIENAKELLSSLGIIGFCHPTSDEFVPSFPKCNTTTLVLRPDQEMTEGEYNEGEDTWFYAKNGVGALICVFMAALAAGLTIGLLSLDPLVLLIKMRAGSTEAEKNQAASLLPIVKKHHQLLVTLLLLNSLANEALPIFLDAMVPSFVAVIMSVTLVLFFGEIIPSAVFTGPNQLKIASSLTPVVKFVMIILFPVAYPIARALDVILHDEDESSGSSYNRSELAALVRILYEERMATKQRRKEERIEMALHFNTSHPTDPVESPNPNVAITAAQLRSLKREISDQESSASSARPNGELGIERFPSIHIDEVSMVEGALQMKTKLALDVFTPMRNVFAIPYDMILTEKNIVQIYSHGYSRIPVYIPNPDKEKDKNAICGVLLTKQLIVVNMSDNRPVSTLPLHVPQCVSPKMNMVDLLNLFQTGGSIRKGGHLALVCTRPDIGNQALHWGLPVPETAGLLGVVTLEDVLEELLQEEILDESDKLERVSALRVIRALRKWRLFVKKKKLAREETELQRQSQPKFLDVVSMAVSREDIADAASLLQTEASPLLGAPSLKAEDSRGWKNFFGV